MDSLLVASRLWRAMKHQYGYSPGLIRYKHGKRVTLEKLKYNRIGVWYNKQALIPKFWDHNYGF